MPVITVQMLDGRTVAQKKALIAELAEAAKRALGVPDEAIRVLLNEMPPEHYGLAVAPWRRCGRPVRARPKTGDPLYRQRRTASVTSLPRCRAYCRRRACPLETILS